MSRDVMIRVMTFNIRYAEGDAGRQRWDRRRALVIARIRAFNPDLLGIQECSDGTQERYVRHHLSEWRFEGVRSGDPDWPLEMAPALHKRSAFDPLDAGHFWLSETPSVPGSRSWDSAFARVATWVRLLHRETGRSLVFLNTHVDYAPLALEASAGVLGRWIDRTAREFPLIVTGDFNADTNSSIYQRLACGGALFDVYRRVHRSDPAAGTFHDYGKLEQPQPIDWILASQDFVAVEAQVDRYREKSCFPSDHCPLTAILRWRAGAIGRRLDKRGKAAPKSSPCRRN
jgi:endonuclease/exonuclease/phosphatase family metal-dependent hydrolase